MVNDENTEQGNPIMKKYLTVVRSMKDEAIQKMIEALEKADKSAKYHDNSYTREVALEVLSEHWFKPYTIRCFHLSLC